MERKKINKGGDVPILTVEPALAGMSNPLVEVNVSVETGLMKSPVHNFSQKSDHHNQYQASNCVNGNPIWRWVCVFVQIPTIGVIIQSIKHVVSNV